MRGAGGTEGGIGQFFIGLVMLIGGTYLFLNAIQVTHNFSLGYVLYRWGGFQVTSGLIMIPFMFGIGIMFYNSKNPVGWLLAGGSMVALIFGVLASIQFRMAHMSLFSLITILVLMVGGLGLFLRSLRTMSS
jgi:hypothetical protein